MSQRYQRDDVYLCEDCWQFHDCQTHEVVPVAYTEIPADMVVFLMVKRSGVLKRHPPTRPYYKR